MTEYDPELDEPAPTYGDLVDQDTAAPTRKLSAGVLGASCATLVVAGIGMAGVEIPPGVEGALATLFAFGAGYLVRDRVN